MSTQTKSKPGTKTAQPAAKPAEEVKQAVADTSEKVVEITREQVEKASETAAKNYQDFTSFQKEGMDALIEAGEIWARGAEEISRAYLVLAQEAAEANSEAAKALLSAKSLKEVVDLQSKIVRKNFDKSLSESTRLSELSMKVANEAFKPLQKQFVTAFEKAGTPA